MKKKVFIFCLILSMAFYFSFRAWHNLELRRKVAWQALEGKIQKELGGFPGEAAILIKDLKSTSEISINQYNLFAAASLVKIPIMAACFYAVHNGKITLAEALRFDPLHKALGSGNLKNSSPGTQFTIQKLVEVMISESDNTATNMLIERLGLEYLNDCFKKLGLKNTHISRRMMDFASRREGKENFTTADDLGFLLEEIYYRRLINRYYSGMCLELLKKQKIRDRIPGKLPESVVVAHKTGLERGLCHDAGIVFAPKGNFLICVLTKHKARTAKLAKNFIAQIALDTYRYYSSPNALDKAGNYVKINSTTNK
jgi:beta-lactamase class A